MFITKFTSILVQGAIIRIQENGASVKVGVPQSEAIKILQVSGLMQGHFCLHKEEALV